jgi:hypothetical protein
MQQFCLITEKKLMLADGKELHLALAGRRWNQYHDKSLRSGIMGNTEE